MESSISLPPYQYRPLEERDSIRVLWLGPGSSQDKTLCGSLIRQKLSSFEDDLTLHYAALSYVWGDPARTKSIELVEEGKRFRHGLTVNLYDALINIREEGRPILIWADAICIDQSHTSERGHQVRLMRTIYQNAGCTVIYLGHLSPAMKRLFDVTTQRSEKNEMSGAVDELCSREWFSRGWTFQELILSRNPRVQCGHYRVGWKYLHSIAQHALEDDLSSTMFYKMNEARDNHQSRTFSQLVLSRKSSHVSDSRDFFFCLMGVASDAERIQKVLPVDYSQDVKQVFTRAARFMIDELGLSSVVANVNSDSSQFGLPSFVPTWGLPSLQATSQSGPQRPICPPSEAELLETCLVRSIQHGKVFPVTKLSSVIPSTDAFMRSFNENLASRVRDASTPDTEGPLQLIKNLNKQKRAADSDDRFVFIDRWGIEQPWLITKECQDRLWKRFRRIISDYRARHVPTSEQADGAPEQPRKGSICRPDSDIYNSILPVIEETLRHLDLDDDLSSDNETACYRWAFCDGHIALVPPRTKCGDLLVQLGLGYDEYDTNINWFVVRPAEEKVLRRKRISVEKFVRNGLQLNPRREGYDATREVWEQISPTEFSIRYGEMKGAATVFDGLGVNSRLPKPQPSYMVLV